MPPAGETEEPDSVSRVVTRILLTTLLTGGLTAMSCSWSVCRAVLAEFSTELGVVAIVSNEKY